MYETVEGSDNAFYLSTLETSRYPEAYLMLDKLFLGILLMPKAPGIISIDLLTKKKKNSKFSCKIPE